MQQAIIQLYNRLYKRPSTAAKQQLIDQNAAKLKQHLNKYQRKLLFANP